MHGPVCRLAPRGPRDSPVIFLCNVSAPNVEKVQRSIQGVNNHNTMNNQVGPAPDGNVDHLRTRSSTREIPHIRYTSIHPQIEALNTLPVLT